MHASKHCIALPSSFLPPVPRHSISILYCTVTPKESRSRGRDEKTGIFFVFLYWLSSVEGGRNVFICLMMDGRSSEEDRRDER